MKALGQGSVSSIVQIGLVIAWWFLWVVFAAVILASAAYAALFVLASFGIVDPATLTTDGGGVRVSSGGATITAYNNLLDAWPIIAPSLAVGAIAIGGALVIVWRLNKLFESFTSGEPFRRENAQHLRVIWITMLAVELARFILLGVFAGLFATLGAPDGATANFNLGIDISTWMSIAILIVLAEVFREGARMKEEQERTI